MYWYNTFIYNYRLIYIYIYVLVLPQGTNEHSHFQYTPDIHDCHQRPKRPALGAAERASCLKRPPGILGHLKDRFDVFVFVLCLIGKPRSFQDIQIALGR